MNNNFLDIWTLNSTWNLLSSIIEGDKLSIRGNSINIHKQTPLISVKRYVYGDSRNDLFQLIDTLIKFTIHHLTQNNDKREMAMNFKINVLNGLNGLMKLRTTYADDQVFLSQFNSRLEVINQLNNFFTSEDNPETIQKEFIDILNKVIKSPTSLSIQGNYSSSSIRTTQSNNYDEADANSDTITINTPITQPIPIPLIKTPSSPSNTFQTPAQTLSPSSHTNSTILEQSQTGNTPNSQPLSPTLSNIINHTLID